MHSVFKIKCIISFVFIFILCACEDENDMEKNAMVPIYANGDSVYQIQNIDTQQIEQAGNIYLWNNLLFINEVNKGIHVIDKSDSSNPVKLTFIKILGNKNYTINNNALYADNGKDLIVIDINDIMNVGVVSIIKDGILNNNNSPPNYQGFFVCADLSKGIIVDWRLQKVINPKCRKF